MHRNTERVANLLDVCLFYSISNTATNSLYIAVRSFELDIEGQLKLGIQLYIDLLQVLCKLHPRINYERLLNPAK